MSIASEPAGGADAEGDDTGRLLLQTAARSVNHARAGDAGAACYDFAAPDRSRPRYRGVHPLTEDRLQFDGPRATYGRFRVLHQIGAGSVGPVFRGEDGETREPVVIKVVRIGLTPERAAVVGAALTSLRDRLPRHPALAACLDAGVLDVEPYLVSAFVDADSLDVALREFGPALLTDALPRLRLLADGLDAAAAVEVSHGGLHLRDILVSVEHTVLQGVGLAAVLERVGVRPPVRRPYCAPEVALGLGIGPAADQYSLAAVAHEWLTGRRLTAGNETAVRLPGLTGAAADGVRDVFARALAETPDARYPTATAFVEAIADFAPYAPGRSRPARRQATPPPPRLAFDDGPSPAALSFADETADALSLEAPAARDASSSANPAAGAEGPLADLSITAEAPGPADWEDNPLSAFAPDRPDEPDEPATVPLAPVPVEDDIDTATAIVAPPPRPIVTEPEPEVRFAPPPSPMPLEESAPDELTLHAAGPTLFDAADVEAPAPAPPEPHPEIFGDLGDGAGRWKTWAGGVVAFTLVALLAGWALVRWGTPSAPRGGVAATPASRSTAPPLNRAPAPPTSAAPSATQTPTPAPVPAPAEPPPPVAASPRPAPPAGTTATSPAPPPSAPRATAPASTASTPQATPPVARQTPPVRQTPPRTTRPSPAPPAPARPAPAPAPAPAAPTEARLLVRSTPVGAEVFINGERRGVTPLALRDLPLGSYAVRVTRPGFVPADARVVLDRGRPSRSIELALVRGSEPGTATSSSGAALRRSAPPVTTTGSLVVETRPAGARVFVDGASVGVTPLSVLTMSAGAHQVRIELTGYMPIITTTTIEAGARARVAVTLTPERP